MVTKLRLISMSMLLCTILMGTAAVVCADGLSGDQYLALRASLGATAVSLSTVRSGLPEYVGKVIDLKGTVNGIVRNSNSTSFIMNCGSLSVPIRASASIPSCVQNGNSLRVLALIAPGSVASLSDLSLEGAAYEYDVVKAEKARAAQVVQSAKPARPATQASQSFQMTRQARAMSLSSRAMQIYNPYHNAIARINPRLTAKELDEITSGILGYSERYGVDPRLIVAIFIAESGFKPTATSRCGAMGLGQLMPGTARGLGVSNAYDTTQNIEGSIKLISGHLSKYGDIALALSAYNAGSGAVRKYKGIPPYRETQNYVRRIAGIYRQLCGG